MAWPVTRYNSFTIVYRARRLSCRCLLRRRVTVSFSMSQIPVAVPIFVEHRAGESRGLEVGHDLRVLMVAMHLPQWLALVSVVSAGVSAVDVPGEACDVTRFWRCQIGDGTCDVIWLAEPPQCGGTAHVLREPAVVVGAHDGGVGPGAMLFTVMSRGPSSR